MSSKAATLAADEIVVDERLPLALGVVLGRVEVRDGEQPVRDAAVAARAPRRASRTSASSIVSST